MRIKNYATESVETAISLHFEADFADIFEVRGMKRKSHGQHLPPEVTDDRVVLGYRGLDNVVRRTLIQFEPRPASLTASTGPPRPVAATAAGGHLLRFDRLRACSGNGDADPFRRGPLRRPKPIWNGTAPGPATSARPTVW